MKSIGTESDDDWFSRIQSLRQKSAGVLQDLPAFDESSTLDAPADEDWLTGINSLRAQIQDPPATEDGSLLEDIGRTWMGASTRLGGAIGYGLEKLGAETFGGFVRELSKDSSQYWDEGLTQTSKESRQKEFFTETADGYEFGDAWTDPRAVGLAVVESLPGTIAGGAAGKAVTGGLMAASLRGTLARGLVAGGVGGTEKVFRLIPAMGPKVAAAIGYGSGEAGVAALSSGGATEDQVRAMSFDVLEQSPEYMAALAATGDREQARDVVARAAGNDAAAMTALTTFVLSAPAGAVLSKFFTNTPLATTRGRAIGLGAGTETVQEFFQSGSEQISQNLAIRDNADPTRQWDEGALNAAVAGAMAGGVMGGGMGAFQPLDPRPATPDPETPSRARATIDDIANDLRRPYAEAAEEGANQARDIVAQSGGDALSQELAASEVVWSAISQSPTRDDVERTYGRQLQMMQVDEQQAQEAEALRQERLKALDQDGEASVAWMSPGPDGQWRPKAEILGLGRKPARARAGGRGLRGQSDPTWQGQPNEMLEDPAEAEAAEAPAAPAPRWQPTGNTVERVMADLSQDADIGSALGTLTSSRALNIVQSPDQLPPEVQAALSQSAETGAPQGLVWKGQMWLVADSIEAGRARGVLLHEGQHYAMERRENSQTYKALQSNFDRLLESGDVNAVRAMRRVQSANTAEVEKERVAYFLEEVVNNPDQASGRERMLAARIMQDVRLWFRETKVGKWLEAHGAGFNLTPQEIVQIVKRGMIRQAQTEAGTAARGGLQASRQEMGAPAGQTLAPELAKSDTLAEVKPDAGSEFRYVSGRPRKTPITNYVEPLSTYAPTVYRETNLEEADALLPGSNSARDAQAFDGLFASESAELALGQGRNTGVVVELDTRGLKGQISRSKPSADVAWQNGQAEFLLKRNNQAAVRDSVRSVTVRNDAQGPKWAIARTKAQLNRLVAEQGWTKEETDAGVVYRAPALREKAADGVPQFSRRQTETPEFKRWFGDSKVVDAEGRPLVVYHGTFNDFATFDSRRAGENTDGNASSEAYAQTAKVGFWFSSEPMAGPKAGYTADMPVYLAIKNPKREMSLDWLAQGLDGVTGQEYREQLISEGYDGIVLADEEFGGTSYVAFEPTQIKSAIGNSGAFDPENPDIRFSRRQTDRPVPDAVRQAASLEASFEHVGSTSYARNRDLKVSLQSFVKDAARKARIDLTERTPEVRNHLVRAVIADAKYALRANENAIGWYDRTLKRALKTLSGIHPELETDEQARFAFTWALAVTSNGMKVDKNFELAEQAYAGFKATGRMPVNVGEGTAAGAINDGLALYNTLVDQLGEQTVRKLMVTEFTVKELTDALGVDITGELMDTRVRGAAILGPKIGNGFFSNLYGFYDALTMDRWLMRTWGRWTGTLIDVDPDKVAKARTRLREVRDAVMADPSARTQLKGLLRGTVPLALDKFAKAISKQTVKKDFRASLNLIEAAGWGSAKGDTAGAELRKAANALSNALDGQKESPGNGSERNWIREVFNQALTELKAEYPDLTMSDLQALLWYPEKKLYESSKTDETAEGYEEEAAPDYANAAAKLARKKGVDVDGRTAGTGPGVAQTAQGEQEQGRGFDPQERTGFLVDRFFVNQSAELVGTQETQTLLTPAGASAYDAFTQLAGRTDLKSAKARADYIKIQRQTMRRLSTKVGGRPSPLAQLIGAITGVADPVLFGVDTNASGTFENVASPNMRLPMLFKAGKKTVVMTRDQVRVLLATLGVELKQAAQAASSFKTVARGAEDTYSVLVEAPAGEDPSSSLLQQLNVDLGYPLSYARVPLGWQIDVNVGGFDTRPTIEQVGQAFDKAFGEANIHIVPRAYDSIYLEAQDYGDILDAFERAEDPGAGARGGEADGGDGRLGRFQSAREAIRQIAEEQDRQLAEWDAGVRRRIQFSRAEVASPPAVDAALNNQYNPEPGAQSAPDSAPAKPLADIQITDDYVIAETGETVSVTERADIRLRQLDKRLAVARRLVLCLGG